MVKASFFILIGILISKVVTYLFKVVIARKFGAEAYGLFSLATIIIGLTITFASIGLADGLIRYLSYYRGKKAYNKIRYLTKTSTKIVAITGVLSFLLIFFSAGFISTYFFHNPQLATYIKILSFSIPFSLITNIVLALLRSYEQARTYSFLVNIFQNISRFIILIVLIFVGVNWRSIALSHTISVIILFGLAYWMSRKIIFDLAQSKEIKGKERKSVLKELFYYSWPLIFVGILYSLFYWTDSLLIGYFKDASSVGIYNVAVTLVGLFGIAPDIFMQIFLPIISNQLSKGKNTVIMDVTKQLSKWIYLMNIPLLGIMIFYPGVVINILFGKAFLEASLPLSILSIGAFCGGFASLFTGLISMKGYSKTILFDFLAAGVINFVLNVLLIPRYGLVGASIATSISWIIFSILLLAQVKIKYGFFPFKKMLRISCAALALLIIIFFIDRVITPTIYNLIGAAIILVLIYPIIIYFCKGFDKNDLDIAVSIKKKAFSIRGNQE